MHGCEAERAKAAAEDARRSVKKAHHDLRVMVGVGALGVVAGVAALMISAYQLSFPVRDDRVHSPGVSELASLRESLEEIGEAQSNRPDCTTVDEPGIPQVEEAAEAEAASRLRRHD